MARYQAQLLWSEQNPVAVRQFLSQLAETLQCSAEWVDRQTVALPLIHKPSGLLVQVLLEFQRNKSLVVLVTSHEPMGNSAANSKQVLEQMLSLMTKLLPQAQLVYRSDRDGPVFKARS
jgi:hypothetical protein